MIVALLAVASFNGKGTLQWRGASRRCFASPLCALAEEMPLFDPQGDPLPFPFPVLGATLALDDDESGGVRATPVRYAFDRPLYLRMCKALGVGDVLGHCVQAGDGEAVGALALGPASLARVGTIGVALRVVDIDIQSRDARAADPFGDEVAVLTARGMYRFVVDEIVSTIPYPVGCARVLRDSEAEDATATAALETELMRALETLVELSGKLEERGGAGAQRRGSHRSAGRPASPLSTFRSAMAHQRAAQVARDPMSCPMAPGSSSGTMRTTAGLRRRCVARSGWPTVS